MASQAEAFFMPAAPGRSGERYALFHPARGAAALGAVLHVPAFAEEMNKSRRMVALQSRALAEAGYAVLQIDLLGCGDSSGESGDASWDDWIDDVVQAARWLGARVDAPLWLWGLRAGCLLAAAAARRLGAGCRFLFWQPPASGRVLWQQFLRIEVAGAMLNPDSGAEVPGGARQRLARGESVEVAGYTIAPALGAGFEQATLLPPAGPGRVVWIEINNRADASLPPAAAKLAGAWQQAGFDVQSRLVPGAAFWQTTEIEEAPALLAASLEALREPAAA